MPEEPFPMVRPILQLPTLAFSPPRVLLDVVSLRVTDAPWCDDPPLDPEPDAWACESPGLCWTAAIFSRPPGWYFAEDRDANHAYDGMFGRCLDDTASWFCSARLFTPKLE